MTDLVERLRAWAVNRTRPNTPEHECHEAADEIESLRARVAELERLLDQASDYVASFAYLSNHPTAPAAARELVQKMRAPAMKGVL